MLVRVLGSAAGGGSPQWNCACGVCEAVRIRPELPSRLTCTIAVGAGPGSWFLCNAGPDLGVQLRDDPALRPGPGDGQPPIHGILLTDAQLDHTAGLFAMRQATALRLYGTATVRDLLTECGILPTLRSYAQVDWCTVRAGDDFELTWQDGSRSPLVCRAVTVGAGRLPRYARRTHQTAEAVVGYVVSDCETGGSVALAPSVGSDADDRVFRELGSARMAFVDGTFWDEEELTRTGRSAATASGLGHAPISGSRLGPRVAALGAKVIYTHLNNTNPALLPDSPQRAALAGRQFAVAYDGAEFQL